MTTIAKAVGVTKNDLYAYLIKQGVARGYRVIPEFVVGITSKDTRKIDLVWARRKRFSAPCIKHKTGWIDFNPQHWTLNKAFEIEGSDIPGIYSEDKGICRHKKSFAAIRTNYGEGVRTYIVLYTQAHDRNWLSDACRIKQLRRRIDWGKDNGVCVIDGNQVRVVIPSLGTTNRRR